jgi:hypothetical protein
MLVGRVPRITNKVGRITRGGHRAHTKLRVSKSLANAIGQAPKRGVGANNARRGRRNLY